MGWTGAAAEDATSAHAALVPMARRRGDADQQLAQGMRGAGEAARSAQERFRTIQKDVEAGVAALRPSLDTPSGRQQLVSLLDSKASEARDVIGQAQAAGAQAAAAMGSAAGGYGSIAVWNSQRRLPASATSRYQRCRHIWGLCGAIVLVGGLQSHPNGKFV